MVEKILISQTCTQWVHGWPCTQTHSSKKIRS